MWVIQRRFDHINGRSAIPLIAALMLRRREWSKRARNRRTHSSKLIDQLVSAQKERFGDRKPCRFGRPEVDNELKFRRGLHR